METHSGFMFEALIGLYKGRGVLENKKSYLYCIWPSTSGDRSRLEISAGDFDVLMF